MFEKSRVYRRIYHLFDVFPWHDGKVDDVFARALDARAVGIVAETRSLASLDPSWGSGVYQLGGGWLVLSGVGMWVNQAIGIGVEKDLREVDVESLITLSGAAGVVPAVEVTRSTHHPAIQRLGARGFTHDLERDVTFLTRPVGYPSAEAADDVDTIAIVPVRSDTGLRQWQEVSATGWGHATAGARRASDAFAAAVHADGGGHLSIAVESSDGRPLGCASLSLREGVAILFGMCTLPADRGRGVQGALVRHRLHHAATAGCDLAATTVVGGGASERNLRRHGFEPKGTIKTFTLPQAG